MAYGDKFANEIEAFNAEVEKITAKHQDFFDEHPEFNNHAYRIGFDPCLLTISPELPDYIKQEIKTVWLAIFG